ncbi:hypothetical protein ATANTOWER_005951 [Ataeniobius toweri]|uniref:Uncharacterized protein n=1 Tax=Ataeniobius toweri TaxID=208326 RepID=A0ABU7C830_9TELE|nr:hypothetical protein [Ataeniobius toweri]
MLAAQEDSRRRQGEEVFEERIASRSSGDARKLPAVCGSAFTPCPVRCGRRGVHDSLDVRMELRLDE